ncbi:hypothetical protein QOZ80_5BG0434240 [Eleusine coracana subsp. coracana]|nr:hypothetical protein QOZ80_5BG0434240 [Eleusine coracana subsp. coracana]
MKPVEVIRRFLRLFKDPKYESIITFILQGDLKTKTMKDVLGKITAFQSYQLGLDDPQPSNLARAADKQESSKSKKNNKKVIIEDDDEGDFTEDLALLMKKMKNFKNKFASKSRDPKAKHKKKRHFNKEKSKGKGKAQDYKKKFSHKALVGEWTSDNSSDESSSSSDEEVAGLAMIKTTPIRALPPPSTCLMATSQHRESEDESSNDSDDEEHTCAKMWSILEQARDIAVKKSKMLDVVRKECKLAKDRVGELESELKDLVTSHEALNNSYDKLKGDHVELHEKYKALEITFEAVNVENLASPSPSSSKSDASTMCDELTTSVEVSSLEPFVLKELHKLKEEREMFMEGLERLRATHREILGKNQVNEVSKTSSLEPFVLEEYHTLKEERKMVMDGFERLTHGRAIYKEILGRNLVNNISHQGLGSYPAAIDIIGTSDSIPAWIKPLLVDDYYCERCCKDDHTTKDCPMVRNSTVLLNANLFHENTHFKHFRNKDGKVKAKALGPPNKKRKVKSIWVPKCIIDLENRLRTSGCPRTRPRWWWWWWWMEHFHEDHVKSTTSDMDLNNLSTHEGGLLCD